MTVPYFTFLQDLKAELQNHPAYQELWRTIETNSSTHSAFVLTPDFILQQNRIWLPQGCSFIPLIMAEFHSMLTGGHMGISKTSAEFHFVTTCLQCQQIKYDHRKSPGLLCPLPVPSRPWEDLSLDFIGGLLAFQGHTVILVVVDRFSKGVHLGKLWPNYTAVTVANLFMEIVGKLHGMPRSLVSDRDPLFVSRF